MNDDGNPRLDRIERILEHVGNRISMLTERFDLMVEHHDREFKDLMKWQVLTQASLDDFLKAEKERGERIDKLVVALGNLVERLPTPKDN